MHTNSSEKLSDRPITDWFPWVRLFAALFVMAAALAVAPADSAEPKNSKKFAACMDAAGGVTANMRDCMSAESERWDMRLNKAYKAILPILAKRIAGHGTNVKKSFVEAERAWLKYRKANCTYYISRTGGTIDLINGASCWLDETARRTLELEEVLEMERIQ